MGMDVQALCDNCGLRTGVVSVFLCKDCRPSAVERRLCAQVARLQDLLKNDGPIAKALKYLGGIAVGRNDSELASIALTADLLRLRELETTATTQEEQSS